MTAAARPEPTWTPLPPKEAIGFFERKGFHAAFDSETVTAEEHARAFTVAKMMRTDLLGDVYTSLDEAIKNGTSPAAWRKQLAPTLKANGWWGTATVADPETGEPRTVQLGSKQRLDMIFDTNLRTSYAAGKWEQIQRTKTGLPFLRYIRSIAARPRPSHLQWADLTLPVDDAFWTTHYPPNGYRCTCSVQQLAESDVPRLGLTPGNAPPIVNRAYTNPKTGEVRYVPHGIDPGFELNVGVAHEGAARTFADKVTALPYTRLGAIAFDDAAKELVGPLGRGVTSWAKTVLEQPVHGAMYPVGALTEEMVVQLTAHGVAPAGAGILLDDGALHAAAKDAAILATPAAIGKLPDLLRRPHAVYRDGVDLVYVWPQTANAAQALTARVRIAHGNNGAPIANVLRELKVVARGSAVSPSAVLLAGTAP